MANKKTEEAKEPRGDIKIKLSVEKCPPRCDSECPCVVLPHAVTTPGVLLEAAAAGAGTNGEAELSPTLAANLAPTGAAAAASVRVVVSAAAAAIVAVVA
eukprot:CAMPEP_0171931898 /NCGR_PEP_ID=MMETSP0993-20121228/29861_1 /TAXON_ID=483369 /ORGANISM="non described non described, Strain CCMP2098" /LENGTH=99 /DNA_ID=CAMNT_0012572037 /DNA_START=37 /DNA_END=334 /DNA_ORIENTATION=+